MKDLDKKIQEALRDPSNDNLDTKETHLTDDLISVFQGRNRWWNLFGLILSLVFFGLGIVCVVQFLDAETTKLQLFWGFGFVVSFLAVGLVKTYFWMEMHTNRILREVKRVELRLIQNSKK